MKKTRHISTSIDFLLKQRDSYLGDIFEWDVSESRADLERLKSKGHKLIGSPDCEGFCPVNGCPGHEVK